MLPLYLTGFKKVFDVGKKGLLVLVTFFLVFALFLLLTDKHTNRPKNDLAKQNRAEIYKTINNLKEQKTQESKIALAFYKTIMCGVIGEACTNNPEDADKNFDKSWAGQMTNLIAMPFMHPPSSGVYWVYSGFQNAGFVPKSYAAEGIGVGALKPFINLWKIFRDASYILLVVILISIGFMVMFRMKLNPQTVISVESALPKIVIALLLITFSFPIAGFLIDLMYVFIALIISLLSNNGLYYNAAEFQQKYLNAGFWTILDSLVPNSAKGDGWGWDFAGFIFIDVGASLFSLLPLSLRALVQIITGAATVWLSTLAIEKILHVSSLKDLFDGWAAGTLSIGETPSAIIGSVFLLIATVLGAFIGIFWGPLIIIGILVLSTIFLLLFRIFFLLFKAYLQMVFFIIFSPLILLFEALPGRSVFGWWFKNLFAEIMTFPIVIAIFILGNVMVNQLAAANSLWKPPFLYSIENQNTFAMIFGLGIVFLIPEIVKLLKELIGVKPLPINIGLGTFFGGAGAALGGAQAGIGTVTSLHQIPGIGSIIYRAAEKNKFLGAILPRSLAQQIADITTKEPKS